jgi:predicted metal-dependent hydrolase
VRDDKGRLMLIEMEGLAVKLLRKPVKNINLRIHRTGDVQVSVPLRLPLNSVYDFLSDKRQWIENHRRRLQMLTPEPPMLLETGELLSFLGQRYALKIHEGFVKQRIELAGEDLHFFTRQSATLEQKQRLLTHWYRDQMRYYLPTLFEKWEALIGVKATTYGIKIMKTRWGSCHPIKKRIWLNLRLIEKPLICLEYVIVHELIHLLEASHNKRFYALMDQYMPEWRRVKGLL